MDEKLLELILRALDKGWCVELVKARDGTIIARTIRKKRLKT